MKTKFVILVLIIVAVITAFNMVSRNKVETEFKPLKIDVGDEFSEIKYEKPMYVLNYGIDDVTGDSQNDMVIVIGERLNDSGENFAENNIDVVVYDTELKTFVKGDLKKVTGRSPKLLFADVNGDSIKEVILVTEVEDLTKNVRIVSIKNSTANEIFKQKDNKGADIKGYFMDGFKAYVTSKKIKFETYLDLKDNKENYITSGFYDGDGRILSEKRDVKSLGFLSVNVVELNGQCGIKTVQRVKGFDNLDILDTIEVVWKYENGSWNIKEAKGEKLGNLLY